MPRGVRQAERARGGPRAGAGGKADPDGPRARALRAGDGQRPQAGHRGQRGGPLREDEAGPGFPERAVPVEDGPQDPLRPGGRPAGGRRREAGRPGAGPVGGAARGVHGGPRPRARTRTGPGACAGSRSAAESPPSRSSASSSRSAGSRGWSAGRSPGACTRSGCTWRPRAPRSSTTRSTATRARSSSSRGSSAGTRGASQRGRSSRGSPSTRGTRLHHPGSREPVEVTSPLPEEFEDRAEVPAEVRGPPAAPILGNRMARRRGRLRDDHDPAAEHLPQDGKREHVDKEHPDRRDDRPGGDRMDGVDPEASRRTSSGPPRAACDASCRCRCACRARRTSRCPRRNRQYDDGKVDRVQSVFTIWMIGWFSLRTIPASEAEERRRAEDREERERAADGERQRDLLHGDALGQLRGDRVDHVALPVRGHAGRGFRLGGFVHRAVNLRQTAATLKRYGLGPRWGSCESERDVPVDLVGSSAGLVRVGGVHGRDRDRGGRGDDPLQR
jgi:hypothetical protein